MVETRKESKILTNYARSTHPPTPSSSQNFCFYRCSTTGTDQRDIVCIYRYIWSGRQKAVKLTIFICLPFYCLLNFSNCQENFCPPFFVRPFLSTLWYVRSFSLSALSAAPEFWPNFYSHWNKLISWRVSIFDRL